MNDENPLTQIREKLLERRAIIFDSDLYKEELKLLDELLDIIEGWLAYDQNKETEKMIEDTKKLIEQPNNFLRNYILNKSK